MSIRRKMKAAVLFGIRDLRIIETEIPEIGPNDVLARIRVATTCGTDLKMYKRGYVSSIINYPQPMGHEWAGDIVEVGENVEGLSEGMRIRAGNSAPCFKCSFCQEGKYNLCENRTWLWGSYAEYIKVPEPIVKHNLHVLPEGMTYEEGSLVEPLACVIHGQNMLNIRVGDTVAIVGAGSIGMMHAMISRLRGAKKIIMIDIADHRLRFAEKLVSSISINPNETDVVDGINKVTNNKKADVVIEAVGLPETWELSLKLVKKGGSILLFGGCKPGTTITVDTELLHYGEIKLIGSFHANPEDFNLAFKLIATRTIDVRPLVTRKMPLDKILEAFELLEREKKDIKIAITP